MIFHATGYMEINTRYYNIQYNIRLIKQRIIFITYNIHVTTEREVYQHEAEIEGCDRKNFND